MLPAYGKVLQELAGMKGLTHVPDVVLPLPKNEMEALLQRSTHPHRDRLLKMLDLFEPGARATQLFLARLITRPAVLSLAYAIAIALQGASWLWVPIALLGGIGAFLAGSKWAWYEAWATLPKMKRWLWLLLLIEPGELAVLVCWGAVWVRLVFVSGLYGLYQAVWVGFSGFGIFAAVLSLVLGYFFSKHLNSYFFFVMSYSRLRKFRPQR